MVDSVRFHERSRFVSENGFYSHFLLARTKKFEIGRAHV